jgi:hypothetical protein
MGVQILGESEDSSSVVLSLKLPNGQPRTLTVNFEFLRSHTTEVIHEFMDDGDFMRQFEMGSTHITDTCL